MLNKLLLSLLILSLSIQASALEMICEGWYQKPGEQLQKAVMTQIEKTQTNWKQSVELMGYQYSVDWDVNMDVIYTTITQNGNSILFTTARVPTYPHNDSFTDLNLPNGPRLSVSCNFKSLE